MYLGKSSLNVDRYQSVLFLTYILMLISVDSPSPLALLHALNISIYLKAFIIGYIVYSGCHSNTFCISLQSECFTDSHFHINMEGIFLTSRHFIKLKWVRYALTLIDTTRKSVLLFFLLFFSISFVDT